MMVSGMCASVQSELDLLFAQLDEHPARSRQVSAQAFSQARRGFSASLFELANERLLQLAQPRVDAFRWSGLRVIAGDGSRLKVSTRRDAELSPDHFAFALYMPGAELMLHASLHRADSSERQMLFDALDLIRPHADLLVLDRGYPGNALVAAMVQRERHFCMRVDASGWKSVEQFRKGELAESLVTLAPPKARDASLYGISRTATTVRLIRDVTPTGHVRVLMTSLLDSRRYPAAAFADLYHQRWRVEEAFVTDRPNRAIPGSA